MGNAAVTTTTTKEEAGSRSSWGGRFGFRRQPSLVLSEEGEGGSEDSARDSTAENDQETRAAVSGARRGARRGKDAPRLRRSCSSSDGSRGRCFFFDAPSFLQSNHRPSMLVLAPPGGNSITDESDDNLSDELSTASSTDPFPDTTSPLSRCYPQPSPSSSSRGGASPGGLLLRYSSSSSSLSDQQLEYTAEEMELSPTTPTPASDLSRPDRPIWIVTTAALPWMTGTAINPLLRAKCLGTTHDSVTLVLPWLEAAEDRVALYGDDWAYKTLDDQRQYLQTQWLQDSKVSLLFYPAKYHPQLSSVFALGDLCELLPTCGDGVCILEEPEHVNFYRAPGLRGWRQKFSHVIGIVHTNYKAYAQHHYSGLVTGPIVGVMSAWMVRAYCDKVIKLSSVLQEYAVEKECVENVHGIRHDFLNPSIQLNGSKIYFLGKMLWCKGLDKLLELEEHYRRATGTYFEIDVFGSGPEEDEIQRAFGCSSSSSAATEKARLPTYAWRRRPMPVRFPGRIDHAAIGGEYKVFVNPSVTEVLCTTTAEAIARGRFVLVPHHPSNSFFAQFPNCLQYKSKSDFCALLQLALSHEPAPLTPDLQHLLTWEAATDRLIRAAAVSQRDQARRDRVGLHLDDRLAKWHYDWGRGKTGDVLRTVLGGGPVAAQTQYSTPSSSLWPSSTSNMCPHSTRAASSV